MEKPRATKKKFKNFFIKNDINKFILLLRKGVYLYEYFKSDTLPLTNVFENLCTT